MLPFQPSQANQYLAVGLVTTVVLVILAVSIILAVYVRLRNRSSAPEPQQKRGRRRRFPAKPADFGGSSLKQDPTLRLTANPLGQVEYSGIGTVREDLYGSNRNLAHSPHIFSPPTSRLGQYAQCPISGPKLAELEEFDENYTADTDQVCPDETKNPQSEELNLPPVDNRPSVYQPEMYVADVHDWIDDGLADEDLTEEELLPLRNLTKGNLVAERDPEELGSTVAYL